MANIAMAIDHELAFDEAPEAYRHLESDAHMGTVLNRMA